MNYRGGKRTGLKAVLSNFVLRTVLYFKVKGTKCGIDPFEY